MDGGACRTAPVTPGLLTIEKGEKVSEHLFSRFETSFRVESPTPAQGLAKTHILLNILKSSLPQVPTSRSSRTRTTKEEKEEREEGEKMVGRSGGGIFRAATGPTLHPLSFGGA